MDWKKKPSRKNRLLPTGVVLALVLQFAVGCSSHQVLEPGVFYKRDLAVEVNGTQGEGVFVVPHSLQYELTILPRGDADLLRIQSCHREESFEKVSSGWFGKNKFRYSYLPRPGIEDSEVCPLRIDVYEAKPGRHSWALIDMEHPTYQLTGRLHCNGKTSDFRGVTMCQGKVGTAQVMEFPEEVRFTPPMPMSCEAPKKISGNRWEFALSHGECIVHIQGRSGKLGRLTTVGYTGLLVREGQ